MKHFYIIGSSEHSDGRAVSIKLGFATDVTSRLSQLQSGNPVELTIFSTGLIKDAPRFEQFVHLAFSDKKIRGEWYRLSTDDLFLLYDNLDNAKLECGCQPCLGFYSAPQRWRNKSSWRLDAEGDYSSKELANAHTDRT